MDAYLSSISIGVLVSETLSLYIVVLLAMTFPANMCHVLNVIMTFKFLIKMGRVDLHSLTRAACSVSVQLNLATSIALDM